MEKTQTLYAYLETLPIEQLWALFHSLAENKPLKEKNLRRIIFEIDNEKTIKEHLQRIVGPEEMQKII